MGIILKQILENSSNPVLTEYSLPRYFILPFQFGRIHCFWACALSQLILGARQTFSQWKMAHYCAVTGCSNCYFRLNRWHKDWCKVHNCLNSNPPCSCEPPFQLFNFPMAKKHPELRLVWCKLVNRAPSDQSNSSQLKLWTPGPKLRICSSHFVDGEATAENPHPTLNLGYPNFEQVQCSNGPQVLRLTSQTSQK